MATDHPPAGPHGALEEIFDGVWFVRGQMKMPLAVPMQISRSMTVVRGDDGGLVIVNSIRLTEPGLAALDALGPVKHVVRVAGFHGRDDGFYRDRYGATVHAVEGQRYERGLGDKKAEVYMEPDAWIREDTPLPIGDASMMIIRSIDPTEGVLRLDREGGILVTGDSLQHTPRPDEFVNLPGKLFMRAAGFFKPYNVGPGWLKFGKPDPAEVRGILDLEFEHVLPGHGTPVLGGAREKYRPALESLG